ncbi:unnamed protein product, partial [Mycena citricolor]
LLTNAVTSPTLGLHGRPLGQSRGFALNYLLSPATSFDSFTHQFDLRLKFHLQRET